LVRTCFSNEDARSVDQDPRFDASVLAEIAFCALSPATNDPGTAIDVIGRALRVLAVWDEPVETSHRDAVPCANVCVPAIRLNDIFTPMARYGTAIVEVGLRLQKVFGILAQFNAPGFRDNAIRRSTEAISRVELALSLESDKHRVSVAAQAVSGAAI